MGFFEDELDSLVVGDRVGLDIGLMESFAIVVSPPTLEDGESSPPLGKVNSVLSVIANSPPAAITSPLVVVTL